MRHLAPVLALLFIAGCSGKKTDGEPDTTTDTTAEVTGDTTMDTADDPTSDPVEDAAEDTVTDAAPDVVPDTAEDTVDDPAEDNSEDPPMDAATDEGMDAPVDVPAEPDAEDVATDDATPPLCSDPCKVGGAEVAGCEDTCGGFVGAPCPSSDLTCVYASGTDAGICIPTVNLTCSIDANCYCFPALSICSPGTSTWTCPSGQCVLECDHT